jgi:hypothetical protein
MNRSLPESPDGDPGRSFAALLDGHLKNGTRPKRAPGASGTRWTNEAFAEACGTTERNVRFWRNGTNLPNYLPTIERELFGGSTIRNLRRSRQHPPQPSPTAASAATPTSTR